MTDTFLTTDTSQAAYLLSASFALREILYETRSNGRRQATFVFEASQDLQSHIELYSQGKALINLALYEHIKSGLLDRIMRGLP